MHSIRINATKTASNDKKIVYDCKIVNDYNEIILDDWIIDFTILHSYQILLIDLIVCEMISILKRNRILFSHSEFLDTIIISFNYIILSKYKIHCCTANFLYPTIAYTGPGFFLTSVVRL